jgi:hypothetical protein
VGPKAIKVQGKGMPVHQLPKYASTETHIGREIDTSGHGATRSK